MLFINKTFLITGGTGSFGSSTIEKLIRKKVKKVIVFSRDEKKQHDLRLQFKGNENVNFFIGDVRDFDSLDKAFKNVDFIFHAAALKQVPSCEFHPLEAIKTNVLGANNVISASINPF